MMFENNDVSFVHGRFLVLERPDLFGCLHYILCFSIIMENGLMTSLMVMESTLGICCPTKSFLFPCIVGIKVLGKMGNEME